MSLLQRVQRFARRHDMWRAETRIVVAVSGGSDSVAMLFLLNDLRARGEMHLAGVAHLDHQIRPNSDEDAKFVGALAQRLGLPFWPGRTDVPQLARDRRQSFEVAGRVARRAFLDSAREALSADVVALGHTLDDQSETVLMRLLRGAGQRGLAGMAASAGRRVRPLLCATRVELRDDLGARGEVWREDPSNADLTIVRNRIRHELLPYLEKNFNASVRHALSRSAEVARADDVLLDRIAVATSAGLIERAGGEVSLDAERFRPLPEALKRRVALYALAQGQSRAASSDDVARLVERMEHSDGKVVLVHSTHAPFRSELPVPGEVRTAAGWIVEARVFEGPQQSAHRADVAQIDAAAVQGTLRVRSRRPGDRLRPVGLGGSKKVQDVLVDRKVPRWERDAVPIVTDGDDRIVWLAGHALSEEFRVSERTRGVIILNLRRI